MEEKLFELLSVRRGHFVLESGHHGNLWLDLDSLFVRPARLPPFARDLAQRLSGHGVEAVVGPLVGGAFVAEMVAADLDLRFAFAERRVGAEGVSYAVPDAFHGHLRGKTVAIVDDAINAGSATRRDLRRADGVGRAARRRRCAAHPGRHGAALLRREQARSSESVARLANALWEPAACPLCAAGVPLSSPSA